MPFENRLRVLIAEKSLKEKRRLTLREIAQEAGVPKSVLSLYIGQNVKRFDVETLEKLCRYFDVKDVSELLVYSPEPPSSKKAAHK